MKFSQKQQPALYTLVIAHYVVSAVCLLVLALMFLASVSDFSGHYFQPHLLAITHLAALGWGTTIILGACYQLIPVVFETELVSTKLPWISFVLFISGMSFLVFSFWVFDPGIVMQTGGLLISAAVLLFAITVILTGRNIKKPSAIYQEFIVSSCIWLLATVLLGLLLVFNFRYPFLPQDHIHFLRLHAHMGIGGWFLLLIIGVSSKLIPMFLVSRKVNEGLLCWSYYLINFGLLGFIADAYFSGLNFKSYVFSAFVLSGLAMYLWFIVGCFKSRLKKKIELPITNSIISFFFLIAATIVQPVIIYLHISSKPAAVLYSNLYGALLFMGWISSLILGQTFKTLPFIVWAKKYEHLAGKVKTPLPANLYKSDLLKAQTLAYILFCIAFFSGLILQNKVVMLTGICCLLIASLTYLINVLIVVFHKSKLN